MLQLQKRLKKILLLLWSVAFYSISEFVCVFFLFQQVKTSGLPNTTSQVASGLLFLASSVQPEACCWRTQQLPGWLQGYVDSSEKCCARPLPGSGVPPVPVSLWGVVLVGWPSGCSGLSSVSLVNKTLKKYLFLKIPTAHWFSETWKCKQQAGQKMLRSSVGYWAPSQSIYVSKPPKFKSFSLGHTLLHATDGRPCVSRTLHQQQPNSQWAQM